MSSMEDNDQDERSPETGPSPPPAPERALRRATTAGAIGALDLDALMEATGGEPAGHWRAAVVAHEAWLSYRQAEEAYWDRVSVRQRKVHTVATLRLAETTLRKTTVTAEHRTHGWSEPFIEELASMCAEYRAQVETDSLADPGAGAALAWAVRDEISPKWPDLDELSLAVDLAQRALDLAGPRLGPGGPAPTA